MLRSDEDWFWEEQESALQSDNLICYHLQFSEFPFQGKCRNVLMHVAVQRYSQYEVQKGVDHQALKKNKPITEIAKTSGDVKSTTGVR